MDPSTCRKLLAQSWHKTMLIRCNLNVYYIAKDLSDPGVRSTEKIANSTTDPRATDLLEFWVLGNKNLKLGAIDCHP